MKLISLNLGIKLSNTEAVIELLKSEDADFVAMQEMVRHLDSGVYKQYQVKSEIDAELIGVYPYQFFGPTWVGNAFKTPEKIDRDFGGHIEQGCQLMSKYPITGGSNEFFHRNFEYMQDWSNWRAEDHGRSVLISYLDINGKLLQILNLHGIWTSNKLGDKRTEAQCRYVVEAAKRKNIATIIVGDFNLLPNTSSIGIVNQSYRNLVSEFDIKTTTPQFEDEIDRGGNVIDYIFVNNKVSVSSFTVMNTNVSDHFPLVLEFELS